jgi:3-isopropylmalate dehydrogenase
MRAMIAVLAGDGIGPEVMAEALRIVDSVASRFGHTFELSGAAIGGDAIDHHGSPLPEGTLALCTRADAVLLGAVGGPKWDALPLDKRPERGLLALRKELGLYANVRPVRPHPKLAASSPLRPELLEGTDLVVVRELTGGLYFGEKTRGADFASDTCVYTTGEIERVVAVACELARARLRKVTSIDKANVLETSRLWRETATRVARERFPDVAMSHELVDAAAMHLVRRPADYDVIVTENMFGDILSDEASVLGGSIGLLPSASLGDGTRGLYEPIHGSAPDIAGRGIANPYGMIASVAMLLRHSLGLENEACEVERAVADAIARGVLTVDLAATRAATTREVGAAVVHALARPTASRARRAAAAR